MRRRTAAPTRHRTGEVRVAYRTGRFEKISISLPASIATRARADAKAEGSSVSAVVTEALRAAFAAADQEVLDETLQADAAESERLAEAFLPYARALLAESEW